MPELNPTSTLFKRTPMKLFYWLELGKKARSGQPLRKTYSIVSNIPLFFHGARTNATRIVLLQYFFCFDKLRIAVGIDMKHFAALF